MTEQKRTTLTGRDRVVKARRLRRKYESGATIRSLAAEAGLSYGLTRVLLLEAKTKLRERGGRLRRAGA
ncbi:transcriptional regulator [Streptomyces sp. Vc74B-19]|uniref:helix-turn-helix domain-containing protein n=1 Tax=Streptomyces sp. Vc74B-19 TaxID=2741324 RepID=UPI001BFC15F6|nr:helix-turn-helix domain-containing protein [Streptomyces sp. Vc74B-19]MBT3164031.1 transcriptional regulator [Streptomyces sp. Vc74B-19]